MVKFTVTLKTVDKSFEVIKKHLKGTFIDTLRLHVKGGSGGSGFPKYGGVGGRGGSVIIQAVEGHTLRDVIKKYKDKRVTGGKGKDSHKRCILGMHGEDALVTAPLGVTIYNEKKMCIGELDEEGQKILVARGGIGGCPETGYGGMKGESQMITIDLKLIADVGFVGFPNAGKSTLLAALSRAKPKIASYPFTTIKPNIGIMAFNDERKISLADLPGLIEGSHLNVGMGHRFLRHVERTKLLLFVVDINGFQLSPKHVPRSFLDNIVLLNKELEMYKEHILGKPAILIVNKMDTKNAETLFRESENHIHNLPDLIKSYPEEIRPNNIISFESVVPFSARYFEKNDLTKLKNIIRDVIDKHYVQYDVDTEIDLFKSVSDKSRENHSQIII